MAKRSAGFLVVSGRRVLLLQRADHMNNPRLWGLPGGQRDRGEVPYETAFREAWEEMDHIPDHRLVGEIVVRRKGKEYRLFVCRTTKAVRRTWRPDLNGEHRRHRWARLRWCRDNRRRLHPVMKAVVGCRASRRALKAILRGAERLPARGGLRTPAARIALKRPETA